MKFLAIVLIVFVIQTRADFSPEEKACAEKTGVSPEDLMHLVTAQNIPDLEDQSNNGIKCYATCLVESANIIDGCSYQPESAKQFLANEGAQNADHIIDECKDSVIGTDPCDCGYSVFKCLADKLHEM